MEHEEVVIRAYDVLLRRKPDAIGFTNYVNSFKTKLLDERGLYDILIGSDEFRRRIGPLHESRSQLNALVKNYTNMRVIGGIFEGLRLVDGSERGDGDISPKLLGTYEQELHPYLDQMRNNSYGAIIDVGCAEGYYAVGLARIFKEARIYAYDTNDFALRILFDNARENMCADRIIANCFCDASALRTLLISEPRSLVVVDCEGYEKELFSESKTGQAGAYSDFIIECHDVWDSSITPTLVDRLSETHNVTNVVAMGRNPNVFDFLSDLSDMDRYKCVWERRAARQNWLICQSKIA